MTPLPEEGSLGFETARLAAGDRYDCPGLDVLARRRLAAAVRRAGDLPVRHAVPGGGAAPARRWTPGTTARAQYRHPGARSEEHTSELQSRENLVWRLQ